MIEKDNKYENRIITIPNLLSLFRIILLPVFGLIYLNAKDIKEYYLAAIVLAISAFTDFADGYIARTFKMVSKFGKAIDPIADKSTHIVVALCLASRYKTMWILIIVLIVKEGFMAMMGVLFLKKGTPLDGAMWFGKVCTATIFIALFCLVVIPDLSMDVVNLLIIFATIVAVFTLVMYIPVFANMWKSYKNVDSKGNKK